MTCGSWAARSPEPCMGGREEGQLQTVSAVGFCTRVSRWKFLGNVFSQIPRSSSEAIQNLEEGSLSGLTSYLVWSLW